LSVAPPPRQPNHLIPLHPPMQGERPRLHHLVDGGVLLARDEPDPLGGQLPEPGVVGVPPVHHHDGAGVEAQGAGHPHVMPLSLGDDHHAGEVAVVVQQTVQFDGAFGPAELGPVEEGRAQVDDGGVQAHQLVLEPERPPALGQGLTARQERLEHGAIELPRAMLVRIGQRGAARGRDAQVLELALAAAQAPADLP
jgi:hypothetical protein